MTIASLIGLAMLGLAEEPSRPPRDAALLVAGLGAGRFADRERAEAALEELGRPALPALRQARDAPDPEVRQRAEAAIATIERQRLTRPTRLTLDLFDRPLEVAIEALSTRSGFAVAVDPGADPAWKSRRVRLPGREPIPFWEALDRLCLAGGVRPADGPGPAGGPIRLVPGAPGTVPTCYSGPFRIRLIGLRRQPPASTRPGLVVRLEVSGEPGLMAAPAGAPRVLAALDDRGQALMPPSSDERAFAAAPGARAVEASGLHLSLPLRAAERPARRIERLRGVIPLTVSARRPDPLVIPIDDATGRTFSTGDASLRIDRVLPGRGSELHLILHVSRPASSADPTAQALDPTLGRVEVVDARGRPCPWSVPGRRTWLGEEVVVLKVSAGPSGSAPAELRVHGVLEETSEVPFEFSRIPLP